MNNEYLRYIIRDELISTLTEEAIQTSPFSPAEEKFLARFAELGAQSLGIIYAPNEIGIREFLGRSGKDFNLTPDIMAKLLKDKIISIVPYGGYSRNQDYTIKCNLPIEELEGMSSGEEEKGGEEDTGGEVAAGPPEESAGSSKDLSKLLVSEQKKKKKHTKSKVYTSKARTLGRLPKGYVVYLERIIQILSTKLHSTHEKEHLVADILDNLAHNFGLTPKEVYRSFVFYKSQNRLQNVVKEYLENDKDIIKLKESLLEQSNPGQQEQDLKKNQKNYLISKFRGAYPPGYYSVSSTNPKVLERAEGLYNQIVGYITKHPDVSELTITVYAGESQIPNRDAERNKPLKQKQLGKLRSDALGNYLYQLLTKKYPDIKIYVEPVETKIGSTPWDAAGIAANKAYKDAGYDRTKLSTDHRKIMNSYFAEQYVTAEIRQTGYKLACNGSIGRSYDRGQAPDFEITDDINVAVKTLQCNALVIPDRFGIDGKYNSWFNSPGSAAGEIREWGILLGLTMLAYPNGKFHAGITPTYHTLEKFTVMDDVAILKFIDNINIAGLLSGRAKSTTEEAIKEIKSIAPIEVRAAINEIFKSTKLNYSKDANYAIMTYKDKGIDNFIRSDRHTLAKYINGTPSGNGILLPKPSEAEIEYIKNALKVSFVSGSASNKKITFELRQIMSRLQFLRYYQRFLKFSPKGVPQLPVKKELASFDVSGKSGVKLTCYAPLSSTVFVIKGIC